MKKYLNISIFLLIIVFAISCVKDDSNTELTKINTITISGIPDKVTASIDTTLTITPIVTTSHNDDSNLDYLWYAYRDSQQGPADTISKEKILSSVIREAPGILTLVFKVTDKKTGVFYKFQSIMTVVNDFSQGLMILSENSGKAKLNFLNTVNGKFITDVYFKVNNEELGTNPVSITFQNKALSVLEIVILCKDKRGGVFANPVNFIKVRELKSSFYVPPYDGSTPINVQSYLKPVGLQDYLIIDGKVYNRAVNSKDVLFKPEILGDYLVSDSYFYDVYSYPGFYDNKNMRFLAHNNTQGSLNLLAGTVTTIFDPKNVGLTMLYGKQTTSSKSFGLFKNPTGTERYILTMTMNTSGLTLTPVAKYRITSENIENATAYAAATTLADYLFYSYGSQIYVHNMLTQLTAPFLDLGAGYTINAMKIDGTELRVAYINNNLSGQKGGFVRYNVTSIGGIKGTEVMRKEGFCDKVVDMSTK